jgi:hypothetical protein
VGGTIEGVVLDEAWLLQVEEANEAFTDTRHEK